MNKAIYLAAAMPIVLSGCQTLSSTFPGMTSGAFGQYDSDGDGVISRQEAQDSQVLSDHFRQLDTNTSGGIDTGEYAAASANIANLDFGQVDINGDGVISSREADAMPDSLKSAFSTVDADGDGNISPTEYRAASVDLLSGMNYKDIDRDGDGVLSSSEAERVPALSDVFERIDTDDDGMVSRSEFKAAKQ